jgi:hypothetical protein
MLKVWLSPPGLVNQCSTFGLHRTVQHQLGAFDVEEQPHSVDEDMHGPAYP